MLGFIPMNQIVEVHKAFTDLDAWGQVQSSGTVKTYKARVDYNNNNQTIPNAKGQEIVFAATITINGVVILGEYDEIVWIDASGVQRAGKPMKVTYKEDLGGNPFMTKVVV